MEALWKIADSESTGKIAGQAAVAFFELLHLHAKGFIKLNQPVAYNDIAISSTEQLHRFKM